jgi:hypothetical protein
MSGDIRLIVGAPSYFKQRKDGACATGFPNGNQR